MAPKRMTPAHSTTDRDNPTWTRRDFARASGPEALSAEELAAFPKTKSRGGRPKLDKPKVQVTLRLDPDVISHFKAAGAGWQSRMNDTLASAIGGRIVVGVGKGLLESGDNAVNARTTAAAKGRTRNKGSAFQGVAAEKKDSGSERVSGRVALPLGPQPFVSRLKGDKKR